MCTKVLVHRVLGDSSDRMIAFDGMPKRQDRAMWRRQPDTIR